MKKKVTIIIFTISMVLTSPLFAQVAINTDGSSANPSAMLDIKSDTAGLLIPRMTAAQRDAIINPAQGLLVFVTDDSTFCFYKKTTWLELSTGENGWIVSGDTVYNTSSRIGIGTSSPLAKLDIRNSTSDTGLYIQTTSNSNVTYGTYSYISGDGSGPQYAARNKLDGAGTGLQIGVYNSIDNSGNGKHYGTFNALYGSGGTVQYGVSNFFGGTGTGAQIGVDNWFDNSEAYSLIGSHSIFQSEGSSLNYGTSNLFLGDGSGLICGTSNVLAGGGDGMQYGVKVSVENSGNNIHYGTYSSLIGSGTGDKYGSFDSISYNAGGTHYGVYSDVVGNTNYAGYFRGRMYVSDSVGIGTDSATALLDINGSLRLRDGTQNNGYVLISDVNGFASWSDKTSVNNSLDEAYDKGGAGVGKNITADAGAVRINGTDGFLVTGTYGSGTNIDSEITGAGTRMFFNPNKSAFRAGVVYGNQWDNDSLGSSSVAMGYNTKALSQRSTAFGNETRAQGASSTAMGSQTNAIGNGSVAMGTYAVSEGRGSSAFGWGTHAYSFDETVVGSYNTAYTPADINNWNSNDRLFVVGNGADASNPSNALSIYKDGRFNINDEYFMPQTDGTSGQLMQTNGSGQLSFADPVSVSGWTVLGDTVYNITSKIGIGTSTPKAKMEIYNSVSDTSLYVRNYKVSSLTKYGSYIDLMGHGTGGQFGLYTILSGSGDGVQACVKNVILNDGDGAHYGVYNEIHDLGLGYHVGTYNFLIGSGNGIQMGNYSAITNSGDSTHYGSYCVLQGTGSGTKYGFFAYIPSATGGSHYGIYSNAEGSSNYAGYFKGNVYMQDNVGIGITTPGAKLDVAGHIWQTSTGYSVFLGENAGASDDLSNNNNVFIGYNAGTANTSGYDNTALGYKAMEAVTDGAWNTALGHYAYQSGNYSNSTALGDGVSITASSQVRIGHNVSSIGGPQNWTNTSDGRFKTDVTENVPGLAFIEQLRPVTYYLDVEKLDDYTAVSAEYRNDPLAKQAASRASSELRTGFIAQEVEKAAQSVGYNFSGVDTPKNSNDVYGLRYAEFVVPLVKAVQEQQQTIETQNQQLELLKKDNTELKARLDRLEKLVEKAN
jgi:hypothetical protein